jgi:CxxC motif-containing protein (DUF1111 family)
MVLAAALVLAVALTPATPTSNDAPAGFDNKSNGLVDDGTAPLWGLRMRTRLMHDGASLTPRDAIARHRKEAQKAANKFKRLSAAERAALLAFLQSL